MSRSQRRNDGSPSRAVGYVRVSTEEQAREGVSLNAQERALDAYCALRGLQLAQVVRDPGVSGGTRLWAAERAVRGFSGSSADGRSGRSSPGNWSGFSATAPTASPSSGTGSGSALVYISSTSEGKRSTFPQLSASSS